MKVWAHGTGELLDTISEHGGHVRALAYDTAGVLLSADSNGKLMRHCFKL